MSPDPVLPNKHRLEALADGIFAVAMTLLVIELKLPAHDYIQSPADLTAAVIMLIPKFVAWIISFFVLGILWYSHHRLFHYVRQVNAGLIWLTIFYLWMVSLLPFSSALSGEYAGFLLSQLFYSANMMLVAMLSLATGRYIYRHPELLLMPMPEGVYRGIRLRTAGLVVVAFAAVGLQILRPGSGNMAFMLMALVARMGRRVEARSSA